MISNYYGLAKVIKEAFGKAGIQWIQCKKPWNSSIFHTNTFFSSLLKVRTGQQLFSKLNHSFQTTNLCFSHTGEKEQRCYYCFEADVTDNSSSTRGWWITKIGGVAYKADFFNFIAGNSLKKNNNFLSIVISMYFLYFFFFVSDFISLTRGLYKIINNLHT